MGNPDDASHEFNHRKARVTPQGAYVQLNRPGGHPLMHTRFSTRKLTKWRGQLAKNGHVSPKMIDQIIKELQWKADAFVRICFTVAFGPGEVRHPNRCVLAAGLEGCGPATKECPGRTKGLPSGIRR
jgi:hypothetical protein